jgi:hypothetical protein
MELGMGSYVFTKARKAAFRKAQEKAWAMRRASKPLFTEASLKAATAKSAARKKAIKGKITELETHLSEATAHGMKPLKHMGFKEKEEAIGLMNRITRLRNKLR